MTKNFIVADHQGNVRNVFNYDAQQNIVLNAAYWYNPFGKQDSVVVYGTGGHRFTYNDKELDDELGFEMYYYGARFYDPSIGRFSSPDPVKDYHNPYSYVRNNPVRYIDPTGMFTTYLGFERPKLSRGTTSYDFDDFLDRPFNPYTSGAMSGHPDAKNAEDHTVPPDATGANSSDKTGAAIPPEVPPPAPDLLPSPWEMVETDEDIAAIGTVSDRSLVKYPPSAEELLSPEGQERLAEADAEYDAVKSDALRDAQVEVIKNDPLNIFDPGGTTAEALWNSKQDPRVQDALRENNRIRDSLGVPRHVDSHIPTPQGDLFPSHIWEFLFGR